MVKIKSLFALSVFYLLSGCVSLIVFNHEGNIRETIFEGSGGKTEVKEQGKKKGEIQRKKPPQIVVIENMQAL